MQAESHSHLPVLLEEAITALAIKPEGVYVDGTFGRGGHSQALLAGLGQQGRLYALDRDPAAVAVAQEQFADDPRFHISQGNFADLKTLREEWGLIEGFDGILLDLGVSSPQLDNPRRGFSFQTDGPLDMRMDPGSGPSAAEWLAEAPAAEIARVLREFGEERYARRIADGIVMARRRQPITRTMQLAELVVELIGRREKHKHPATRTFQAIRIKINNELAHVADGLKAAIDCLRPGGRLVVISFHSLEDRLVKRTFREAARPGQVPRRLPAAPVPPPRARLIGGAHKASDSEIEHNPRARSAVMRVLELAS